MRRPTRSVPHASGSRNWSATNCPAMTRSIDCITTSSRWPAGSTTDSEAVVYDGHLEASTAVKLSQMFGHVLSDRPVSRLPACVGEGGDTVLADRRPRRVALRGDRRTDPPRRHDQAPGEDGHGRDLAQRRGHHRPPAGAGGAVGGRRTRRPQLPHAQDPLRPRSGGRHGARVHQVRHRPRARHGLDHRPWRHLPRSAEPCRRSRSAARHQASRRLRTRRARRARSQ